MRFEEFVTRDGPRLRAALVAAYGVDAGVEAEREALAYGFENWHRVGSMDNPAGYLYRVGQTRARRSRRPLVLLPSQDEVEPPGYEPGLVTALQELSDQQRISVVMVHALGWSQVETAELLGVDESTVRTHLTRGLKKLRASMGVDDAQIV